MTELVPSSGSSELDLSAAYELLAEMPAERLWLANFMSGNTRKAYRNAVAQFMAVMGISDQDGLYGVSQGHVIAFREYLVAQDYSRAAIANRLSALSSLYKFLADKQLVPVNPVSGVKRPHTGGAGIGSGKTPALTAHQVRTMLDAPDPDTLQGLRDRAILHVFFYTGGRVAEPSGLKVKDFHQDREYWVLDMVIKGGKQNTVAIHTECQIAIHRYLQFAGHGSEPEAPLFKAVKYGQNTGGPLRPKQFHALFMKYARLAAMPVGITPHSARATFISLAYEAGLQGEDIQRTVGHASITTTEGYNQTAKKHRKSASFGVRY